MTALLWPGVALVAVVLAFVVARKAVALRTYREGKMLEDWLKQYDARFAEKLDAQGKNFAAKLTATQDRVSELESVAKKLDARTSNDPALARLPVGLRGRGP